MVSFNKDAVFNFLSSCGVKDHGKGAIPGWGFNGAVSFFSATPPGATAEVRRFVLFSGLTATKIKTFTKTLRDTKVASGYQVMDAFSYNAVAVLGTLSPADLALLQQEPERVVKVIDPAAANAVAQLQQFLTQ